MRCLCVSRQSKIKAQLKECGFAGKYEHVIGCISLTIAADEHCSRSQFGIILRWKLETELDAR